jgi:hypothetical protein
VNLSTYSGIAGLLGVMGIGNLLKTRLNGIVFLLIFYTFYDTIFTPIYSQYVSTVRLLLSLANKDDKKRLSILLLNLRILP